MFPSAAVATTSEPIRACQLGDLRWSTPRRGDGSEPFGIRFNDNEKGRATTRGT
jgi:hypothetical protein